jgi:hydroxylamine reductase (hybrid-cluster protein)
MRKNEEVAKLQDLLVYAVQGISELVVKAKVDTSKSSELNREVLSSLFMTITNANFDGEAIAAQIKKMLCYRDDMRKAYPVSSSAMPQPSRFRISFPCLIRPLRSAYLQKKRGYPLAPPVIIYA